MRRARVYNVLWVWSSTAMCHWVTLSQSRCTRTTGLTPVPHSFSSVGKTHQSSPVSLPTLGPVSGSTQLKMSWGQAAYDHSLIGGMCTLHPRKNFLPERIPTCCNQAGTTRLLPKSLSGQGYASSCSSPFHYSFFPVHSLPSSGTWQTGR